MNPQKISSLYEFGPFKLNAARRRLTSDGVTVPLARIAFDLLLLLLDSAGHLQSREALIEALWPTTIVEENSLSWYVSALRKALGDEGKTPRYIETVRGQGYRFIGAVHRENAPSPPERESLERMPDSESIAASHRRRTTVSAWFIGSVVIVVAIAIAGYFVLQPSGETNRLKARSTATSIAVLPFENLSPDKRNAYFVRGIQDLIITKLASIGSLKVISRTSTEHYPSHPDDLRTIARQLGVATILEGSVQKNGNRVLVNLQLIDAKSGLHIWAHAYTRKLDNVLDVESKVAQEVAAALQLQLFPQEQQRLARVPTGNPKAYDLFLRADYLAAQVETLKADNPARTATKAEQLYQQALAQDPDFALAQARLSMLDSYVYGYDLDHTPARVKKAQKAAAAAIESGLPQGHLAMGYVYYRGYRAYGKALVEFKQARRMIPNNVEAMGAIAFVERRRGHWRTALNKFRRAELLDPRNPLWHLARGETLAQLRRYTKADDEFDHAFSLAPQYYLAIIYKAAAQLLTGKTAAARHSLGTIPENTHLRGMFSVARFNSAWLERQPDRALTALAPAPATMASALFLAGKIPTTLLRARAWALKDVPAKSEEYLKKSRQGLKQLLRIRPDDPNLLSFLALTEVRLGNAAAAIRAAKRAVKQLPIASDALYGPSHLLALAMVYAQSGHTASAVKLLKHLLAIPAGLSISASLLRLDPAWDPIRHDPRFQKLLKQYSKPPAAASQ